jgi:hypothetical protein
VLFVKKKEKGVARAEPTGPQLPLRSELQRGTASDAVDSTLASAAALGSFATVQAPPVRKCYRKFKKRS